MSFLNNLIAALFGKGIPVGEEDEKGESLLHVGWEQREESFYPAMFGPPEGPAELLEETVFREDFGRNDVHPFWLHHGVMTFPPTETRKTWLYATSGMSNAFDSEVDDWSGLGVEYILETKERADWAVDKLGRLMAFNLLIAAGHYQDQSDLTVGSFVRLGVPVNGEDDCNLSCFIALEPSDHQAEFQLVTGKVEFLQMVAATEAEIDFAETMGFQALSDKLDSSPDRFTSNPDRQSVVL